MPYARFPTDSDSRVVISRLARNPVARIVASRSVPSEENEKIRGIEGLRPAVISFPWITVEKNAANSDMQPLACAATEEPIAGPGACYVSIDALDRVVWWISQVAFTGAGPQPSVPPQVNFEVRCAASGASDLAIAGTTAFTSYEDRGLLASASGILCQQWELWGRIDSGEPSGSKLRLKISGSVDRMGGGAFVTGKGILAA